MPVHHNNQAILFGILISIKCPVDLLKHDGNPSFRSKLYLKPEGEPPDRPYEMFLTVMVPRTNESSSLPVLFMFMTVVARMPALRVALKSESARL